MNRFGAAAIGFNSPHPPQPPSLQSNRSQQQQLRLRRVALATAAATAGAAGMHMHRQGKFTLSLLPSHAEPQQKQPFLLPKELAEVICGAIGEIVQVAVLYPLDTVKVRCQAGGLPVGAAVKQLMASGGPANVLKQLYAGVFGASVASVAVGSLYYFTFCSAKRAAMKLVADAEKEKQLKNGGAVAAGVTGAAHGSQQQQHESHHYPHGAGVDYIHDPVFAAVCSDEATAAAKKAAASSKSATGTAPAAASSEAAEPSHNGKLQANIMAACAAALVGALVEAPLELFKHRAQAGQLQGNMLGHMFRGLKTQGPAALYGSFFLPFCFKSLPFDIGELVTYSSLTDWKEHALAAGGGSSGSTAVAAPQSSAPAAGAVADTTNLQQQRALPLGSITAATSPSNSSSGADQPNQQQQQPWVSSVPEHAWDMAIGAAAGAAAVLLSHPNDCIKTVMETGGGAAAAPGSGAWGSASAFVATGKQLVKQRGIAGGLMTGLAPRLVESVPSTMLYWLAVENCRRLLEPYTAK